MVYIYIHMRSSYVSRTHTQVSIANARYSPLTKFTMSETYEQYKVDLDGILGDPEEPFPNLKKVKVEAQPLPLEPGYVRVRLRAAAVNWRDLLVVENSPLYIPTHQGLVPLGDGAGEIVEISSKGSLWSVGDRVISVPNCGWKQCYDVADFDPVSGYGSSNVDGTLSKFKIVRDDGIVKAPSNLSWEEAACLPVAGGSAWNALFHGPTPVKPGDFVLTEGTGGLSTFAIQVCLASFHIALHIVFIVMLYIDSFSSWRVGHFHVFFG